MAVDFQLNTPLKLITLPDSSAATFWQIFGDTCYVINHEKKMFWKSTDLGSTWISSKLQLKNYVAYDDWAAFQPIGQLLVSPDRQQLYFLYPGNGLLTSHDTGLTWFSSNEGLPTEIAYQIEFSKLNPSIGFLATNDGFYKRNFNTSVKKSTRVTNPPGQFSLSQNYPNPFNSQTRIHFHLQQQAYLELAIFNLNGQQIVQLLAEELPKGVHILNWDGLNQENEPVPSGIYWYQLKSKTGFTVSKKNDPD